MFDLVIDGTDGAGKTPLVQQLIAHLSATHSVATCAPYRVREVFPLWQSRPTQAAQIITEIMADFRSRHPDDLIVWDRGWPTAWVSTTVAAAKAAFEPLPDLTVLLLNTTAVTRMRAAKHQSTAPWMTQEALIEGFNASYRDLADHPPTPNLLTFYPDEHGRFDLDRCTQEITAHILR